MHAIVPNVKKIAVLQAKAFGDFIVTLPALRAVKETYPEAELVYLGKPWHKEFLEGRPSPIDRVIVIPPLEGVRNEPGMNEKENKEALEAFFQHMQQEAFDIV